ncbi:hypothetical protein OKA05_28330 [Luteolibacter arcticus]|uniref:Immunity protein 8 n=1 Tax=Luteolibacter arcticus TaxID=1581411 RepID=A0ABT3GSK3_9BACT|nr:hypothetical protein [Luteolibacter arcticus]MCW1926492.1 hypothetical protein [Luteolibacter arcticus]
MNVYFGQIYIEPGVEFPWSLRFQRQISDEISPLISASESFIGKFGGDWSMMFRISAKQEIDCVEVRGPTVFKKSRSIEFSLFLPFDIIPRGDEFARPALNFLFDGIQEGFAEVGIEAAKLEAQREQLIDQLCRGPGMIDLN